MNQEKFNALVNLMDDPSDNVYSIIKKQLLIEGYKIKPLLETAWENQTNELALKRIENIIQKIEFNYIENKFKEWVDNDSNNLAIGVYLITKLNYPELSFSDFENNFEQIKTDVWLEINQNLTAIEKIDIINKILFNFHKLKPNATNSKSIQNAYINEVFQYKNGDAFSIGLIYLILAQKLNLPIYGVDLPNTFILAYKDNTNDIFDVFDKDTNVLFYINPFVKGGKFNKKEIELFIKQQKLTFKKKYFKPCSNKLVINKYINYLKNMYSKINSTEKIAQLDKLLSYIDKSLLY